MGTLFWGTAMTYDLKWSEASIFFVATCVAIVPESLLTAINASWQYYFKYKITKSELQITSLTLSSDSR
jgi:hypothetical protein